MKKKNDTGIRQRKGKEIREARSRPRTATRPVIHRKENTTRPMKLLKILYDPILA